MAEQGERNLFEKSKDLGWEEKSQGKGWGSQKHSWKRVSVTPQISVLALLLSSYGYGLRQTASFLQASLDLLQLFNKVCTGSWEEEIKTRLFWKTLGLPLTQHLPLCI